MRLVLGACVRSSTFRPHIMPSVRFRRVASSSTHLSVWVLSAKTASRISLLLPSNEIDEALQVKKPRSLVVRVCGLNA